MQHMLSVCPVRNYSSASIFRLASDLVARHFPGSNKGARWGGG